ncbi:hypothetical protein WT27_10175 [Burkholderia territorii]|uniref:Uncharacterized protein n=1 Tax=Burkholderia territorii TaxID=1503055 RepID=A0A105V8E9_9BURK|nr:hypothetical protein WT27_10175 [Burkholderia territorii]KVX26365.1 hypothetical protein WT31_16245 [Burkholderia territorii]
MLIGLGLALVTMLAVSFYWLAAKDRPTRRHAPSLSRRLTAQPDPRSVDADEDAEWEAPARYPFHAVQTVGVDPSKQQ